MKVLFFEDGQVDKLEAILKATNVIFPSFTNISIIFPGNLYGEVFYTTIKNSDIKYVEYSAYFDFTYMFNRQTISFDGGMYPAVITYFVNNDNVARTWQEEAGLLSSYIPLREHLEKEGLLETSNSI